MPVSDRTSGQVITPVSRPKTPPDREATVSNTVRRALRRWTSPEPASEIIRHYERVSLEVSPELPPAGPIVIASLIHQGAEFQHLIGTGQCTETELLMGDLCLAIAGRLLPRLVAPNVAREFSSALMTAALGLDYEARLRDAIAAAAGSGREHESNGSQVLDAALGSASERASIELGVLSNRDVQLMDITDRLAGLVAAFGLSEGRIHVFPLHTTMGVIVTEREALLHLDLRGQLERLVPSKAVYNHDQLHLREHISDNERLNGAAHCRQLLLPPELSVPVVGGKLRLGTWQRVFLIELDGPQVRKVLVQMEGDFDHTYQQDKAITLERALLRAPERDPADVRLPMGALLSGGGKRIRPRLAMLAAELGPRYDGDAAVRLGVALELLHNATLIHDDIVDHSPFRRDSPTIHVVYGCPTATRVGVYYFGRSYAILAALGNPRVSRLVMDAIALLGRGQLEEYRERRGRSEKARYFAIAAKKTSALTAAACAAGAALSGADQATIDALSVFGQQLGMAFQVVDDVLDFSPTSGKRVGQDARQAVASLPMLFVEDDSQRKQVEELLLSGEESDTEAALELMRRSAALEKSMTVARHFRDGALKALETLRPHPAANGLRELADFAVARDR